jgi:bifunctional oligoribonuclease and PAP phosphatase NrnA
MRIIRQFKLLTKKAKNIVITTHLYPDADGVGSQLGLCLALRQTRRNVFCVNEEDIPRRYSFLNEGTTLYTAREFNRQHPNFPIDLFIIVDAHSPDRVGTQMQKIAQQAKELLFIDHHPCPEELRALHCIDTQVSATGEIVGKLIQALKLKFTPAIALPLYTAMVVDTSSFRYQTVTGDTHRLVAQLMDTGAINPQNVYNLIYGTRNIGHMQLLGQVLSEAQTTEDETIAWLTLREDVLKKFKVAPEDTNAFINQLLILDNTKIACMFREEDHHIKVALRSSGEVDVGQLAQALGGGGHNHSAATVLKGPLNEVVSKTILALKTMLKAQALLKN